LDKSHELELKKAAESQQFKLIVYLGLVAVITVVFMKVIQG